MANFAELREKQMAQRASGKSFAQIKASVPDEVWIKGRDAANLNLIFNVDAIELVNAPMNSKQWKLQISLLPESIPNDVDLGLTANCNVFLSLAVGSRDTFMRQLQACCPHANCYIDIKTMPSGSEYFDLCQIEEESSPLNVDQP